MRIQAKSNETLYESKEYGFHAAVNKGTGIVRYQYYPGKIREAELCSEDGEYYFRNDCEGVHIFIRRLKPVV